MEIDIRAPAEDFDEAAFTRAIERLLAVVPENDDLRLEVTTDLRASVRAKHPDPDYAAKFEQTRDLAFVMGKTVEQEDGSTDIILDARVFSLDARAGQAERTLEHEGLHVAVRRRGEQLSDIRNRHGDPASAIGITLEIAGATCEEFRVERTLWESDPDPRADSHLGDFEGTLRRFDGVVRQASRDYRLDRDVDRIMQSVGSAFNALATSTGYVAAEYHASEETRLPQVNIELGRRLLGGPWVELVRELVQLPAADVPAERADLDARAHATARHIEGWFAHVGFAWEDLEGGGLFFHVLKAAEWAA